MNNVVELEITKSGRPAMWEQGGGMSNSGRCTMIAGSKGERKKTLYIRNQGPLANSVHALIPVEVNDVVVECYHKRGNFDIRVYRVWTINGNTAELLEIARFVDDQWIGDARGLDEVIEAGKKKSMTYHCRKAMYVKE